MEKRDWKEFWKYAREGIKYSVRGILLVPLFFLLMNTDFHDPDYFSNLMMSTRIGSQIAVLYWIVATVFYGIIFQTNPKLVRDLKKSLPFQILSGISIMVLGLTISSMVEPYISGNHFGFKDGSVGLLIGGVTFTASAFYVAYRQTLEHNLRLRVESAEATLSALKNQMQPHFLFNSLNSLSELIDSDKEQAARMTQRLSDLYREILQNSKTVMSTLESETSIIRKYLQLEQLRFGERLRFEIQCPNETEKIFIPSLLLQTLVENGVKHGIAPSVDGGAIIVTVGPDKSGFRVEIKNSGNLISEKALISTGTGIANTVSRLNLLYGEKHQFSMKTENEFTRVSFWISGLLEKGQFESEA